VAAAEVRGNPNFKGLAWGALEEIFRKAGKSTDANLALGMALSHYESKGNVAAAAVLRAAAAKTRAQHSPHITHSSVGVQLFRSQVQPTWAIAAFGSGGKPGT